MRAFLLTLTLATLPGLASARCVKPEDLATGIAFKRQDGRTGLATASGKEVSIDYATNAKGAWTDRRKALRGIYETEWNSTPTEDYYVGGGPGGLFTYRLAGKPPVPKAGATWATRIKVTLSVDNGTEHGPEVTRSAVEATYSFQPVSEAKLSGCTYRIQPVEAVFLGKDSHATHRWIYFPDLGFGLETRVTDHRTGEDRKLGLTALKPKG